jgi:carboxymethylenebutenolidase
MGQTISLTAGDGHTMSAYRADPAGTPKGGIVVIQEIFGINAHMRDVCDRFAAHGYAAIAPALFDRLKIGVELGYDEAALQEGFGYMQQVGNDTPPRDIQAAADELKKVGKVGAIGFCWGGGTVNQIAVNSPDLAAAAPYYGSQPPAEDAARIKARLLLHYAGLDDRINAGIDAFTAALTAAGVDFTVHIYEGANHAFNNDTAEARYHKTSADLAWSRTIAFLKETIG